VAGTARQAARVQPAYRRHLAELEGLEGSAVLADRAMRNARVLTRRSLSVVRDGHEVSALAALLTDVVRGVEELASALGAGAEPTHARQRLTDAAHRVDPFTLAPDDFQVQGLVLLLRSLVVDLLEAAGVQDGIARESLPEI
jgi:hypothetical protein